MSRGGKRKGAGRPPASEPRQRVTVSLPVSLVEEIGRIAYKGSNRSAVITQLLDAALKGNRIKRGSDITCH